MMMSTRRGMACLLTATLVAVGAIGMGGCAIPAPDGGASDLPSSETGTAGTPEVETGQASAGQDATAEPVADATATYTQIDQETAKEMMVRDDGHVIVDVRRQDEYEMGHIPGAILIPNESITDEHPAELPDTEQTILVYCRSGRRSKEAAQKLADMGYAHVYEFGGIIDWTGEVVTKGTPA